MQIKMVQTKHLQTHLSSLLAYSYLLVCSTGSAQEGTVPLQVAPRNKKRKQAQRQTPDAWGLGRGTGGPERLTDLSQTTSKLTAYSELNFTANQPHGGQQATDRA